MDFIDGELDNIYQSIENHFFGSIEDRSLSIWYVLFVLFVFILRFILVFVIPILQVNKDIVCFLNEHISTEMIELTLQKNT